VLLTIALLFLPARSWGQLAQTIFFTQPPAQQAYAGTSVVLAATATSGLPVTFSVISGPAQVSGANGSTLTYMGVGTVVVQADQAGGNGYSPAPSVQAPPVTVSLLTEPVTTLSSSVTTVVTFTSAGTLAQMVALTQGAISLDFRLPTGTVNPDPSLCRDAVTYAVGQTCSLSFTFKPTRPGIRYGGITLSDAAGNLLANSYIYGYGVGPQVLYQPVVQSMIGNSLGQPSGVAINGNGDLFVSNYLLTSSGSGLVEITAAGAVVQIGSFSSGKDVAVDGSGNVFIQTEDTLYEVVAVNGTIPANPIIRTIATGFTVDGGGIAIDGSGNAYIANGPVSSTVAAPTGVVYVVYAVGGIIPTNSPKQIIGPMFASPTGVAVDSSGNVYVSNGSSASISEMLAVNGRVPASPVIRTLGKGSVSPSNIRLDNTNDIFISDSGYPGILEYQAVNGVVDPNTPPIPIGSGFMYPQGLLVDDAGDVFVADQDYPQVVKLSFSSVPSLTFVPTYVGQTSTDSPQAVTYTNAGNADLVFTPPAAGNNPAITPGFSLATSSTCPQLTAGSAAVTLGVGQSCTDQVSFTPLAPGPQSGTLTTVDNDLSVPNATQVVPLNGTGISSIPVIQFSVPQHFVDDPPFTVAAMSNSPGTFTYSVQSGPASVASSTVTLTGLPGNVTMVASQAASSPYAAGSATAIFAVVKHPQTITFPQPATPVPVTAAPITLVATASSGLPVVFSIVSGPGIVSGNQLTFSGFGPVVIAADQPGNNIYDPAPEVTRQIVVLDNRVTVTLSGVPNPVFLNNPITFSATVAAPAGTPTGSITFLDGTVPLSTVPMNGVGATFTTSTLTLGLHTITAVYSGDATFTAMSSAPLNVLVEDFVLSVTSADVTIIHGGTAHYALHVNSVGALGASATSADVIQFAIAGAPDDSVITFTPSTIPSGSGSTEVALVIATPNYPVGPWNPASIATTSTVSFAFLVGAVFLVRKRKRPVTLLAVGLLTCVTALSGCGSGWRTQKWYIQVTASSGNLARTTNLTLTSVCQNGNVRCPVEKNVPQ